MRSPSKRSCYFVCCLYFLFFVDLYITQKHFIVFMYEVSILIF